MKFLISILSLMLFISCGKDEADVVKVPGDTVAKSELKVPSESQRGTAGSVEMEGFMSDDVFLSKSNKKVNLSNVYATASAVVHGDTSLRRIVEDDDGIEKCLNLDSVKLEASGDTISVKKAIDLSGCIKPALENMAGADADIDISNTSFGINMKIQCKGGDLSAYNGKKFSELEDLGNLGVVCSDENATIYMNMVGKIAYSAAIEDNSVTAEVDIKLIVASSEGKGCAVSKVDAGHKSNDCIHIQSNVTYMNTNGQEKTEREYQRILFNNVVSSGDTNATYFQSGTMTVHYRNWTGSVEHKGTGFTYNLTNGTDNVEGHRGTVTR